MLPIILSVGPVTIYSYGVFVTLGLFAGLYWWWKIGRDEHWDETKLFDIYFLALFAYWVLGRAAYVATHQDLQNWGNALAVLAHPGVNSWVGIIAAAAVAWIGARRAEWDQWRVMDAATVVMSIVVTISAVGMVLNGSNPGRVASLGYVHPGDTVSRIPVDLWILAVAIIAFGALSRIRKNFRFYAWYKGEASVAKDGLTLLVGIGMMGVELIGQGILSESKMLGPIPVVSLIGTTIVLASIVMIYLRSGINIYNRRRK